MEAEDPQGIHSLNKVNLKTYLGSVFPEIEKHADLTIKKFSVGQSNPTYYVKFGEKELVLRKKPPGKLLKGAHQVGREYKVMLALGRVNFPVPRMISYCPDTSVLGTEFFVMEYMKGRVVSWTFEGLTKEERRSGSFSAIETLAKLHKYNPAAIGLDDFGKKGGFCGRVLNTWTRQYNASADKDIPQMTELMKWLQQKLPEIHDETAVIHGDYSISNLMFHPNQGKILAVLDWELSTIGHPLMDFAYFCVPYHASQEYFLMQQASKEDVQRLFADLPTEDELIRYYCKLRGIPYPIPNWNFYLALNFFKLAGIVQGVYARSLQGNASSPYAAAYQSLVLPLINTALKLSKQGEMAPSLSPMTISPSPKGNVILDQVKKIIKEELEPREMEYWNYVKSQKDPFCVVPIMDEWKAMAKKKGLWNLFLPGISGLSNVDYAHIAEQLGRSSIFSEVFNCSAPDTGNMEVLYMYGDEYQKKKWLQPLLNGEIRSAFCMTEPQVASSDATNMELTIIRDGDHYIVNGRKWWSSGAGDPRCKIGIVMGKTGSSQTAKHKRHSMIVVPFDTPGVRKIRDLQVFGYNDAPHGHSEMEFDNVRVPVANLILGEGRGFEIAQGRLGPGRIHHCMRSIGLAERAMEMMVKRGSERRTFGKRIIEHQVCQHQVAECRILINQSRLLTLHAAYMIDNCGAKGARKEIAMIKVAVPRMLCKVIDQAIQIHGGNGVCQDTPLAAWYSGARTLRIADGPDEVHLGGIAKLEIRDQLFKPKM
uniref:Acyl-CoA dehydrogenase family member 11 n=1 Tax=Phallusia mammillata TaxID=59560 RepID=A0A6F9D693_9ASCI|nr:acyl-CoA dehydrogenase family member 11 [Phallusia mammillata]